MKKRFTDEQIIFGFLHATDADLPCIVPAVTLCRFASGLSPP